jgi:ribonuclease D
MRKLLKVSSILLLLLIPDLNLISEENIAVLRPGGRFNDALSLPCYGKIQKFKFQKTHHHANGTIETLTWRNEEASEQNIFTHLVVSDNQLFQMCPYTFNVNTDIRNNIFDGRSPSPATQIHSQNQRK